ncbi:hypothetical protein AMC99_00403 [Altererythrobacter epoxidivorans]|uniref:Uncharacterized protein n=1 Tax=Altererythrobacter epoxidivorans TaxID=361183 RepID=A0A0M4M2Q4_9SPHN|nr:hypothetical protein AMC99_00403 [Altererythrobacter epoxidivorans]
MADEKSWCPGHACLLQRQGRQPYATTDERRPRWVRILLDGTHGTLSCAKKISPAASKP